MVNDKKRLAYLDMLRIIACFLVMFNHTAGYIKLFEYDGSGITPVLLLRLFLGMIVKIHVPTFFMITGALMLGRHRSIESALRGALKFFMILLIFSIIANVAATGKLYLPGFIRTFASADVDGAGPYWYLYAHIGILLIMPFLAFVAEHIDVKLLNYLIILRLMTGVLVPVLFIIANRIMDSNMHLAPEFDPAFVTVDCIFYPLVGFGLDKKIDIKKLAGIKIFIVALLFFVSAFLECAITLIAGVDHVFSGFDFIMSICFFLVVKYLFTVKELSEGFNKVIVTVGSLTFGMYLLDPITGDLMEPHVVSSINAVIPSLLLACVIHCLLSMTVGGTMTFCWRIVKNGYIEKYKKR